MTAPAGVRPLIWSEADAGLQLGISERQVRELVQKGELTLCHEGRFRRITDASLRAHVDRLVAAEGDRVLSPQSSVLSGRGNRS